jgi:hypothetical protein
MWYEILVENEFADYFINNNSFLQDAAEKRKADEMLNGYSEIIYGATIAWNFYDDIKKEQIRESLTNFSQNAVRSFDFCCSQIHLSQAKFLHEIWHSISTNANESKYCVDISHLTSEQCAALIMYPFFSRMGGSFEKEFQESGGLKKYLLALKNKCMKD